MLALRLHQPGGLDGLRLDEIDAPAPAAGEALVHVHAASITRDELEWPADRLPTIPSYELSGVVVGVGEGVESVAHGDAVFALTPFDRDGVAAEYAVVPADRLAPKPATLDHVESAAVPLAGLSAWQGLLDHGHLQRDERVLIHGASGGVGQFATQLARSIGAYVIGSASGARREAVLELGAHEAIDRATFDRNVEPVDLVFDTAGGDTLLRSASVLRKGGRIVSIAEEAPGVVYFVVEPNRDQLVELTRLIDAGELRPRIDSVFPLVEARAAFKRSSSRDAHGKVVLRVANG